MTVSNHPRSGKETMTFLQHLEELRKRLIRSVIALAVGIVVCWFFREDLRTFLEAPLYTAWRSVPGLPEPTPLSFKSLTEPFMAYLKIATIGGVFVASPFIFYQIWKFVAPGLYKKERRVAFPFVFVSSLLFIIGAAGAYTFVLPIGFSLFLQFSSGGNVSSYESTAKIVEPLKKNTAKKGSHSKDAPVDIVSRTYSFIENRIPKKKCADLMTTGIRDRQVQVIYKYNTQKCDYSEQKFKLYRNGKLISAKFDKQKRDGQLVFKYTDAHVPWQEVKYQLNVTHMAKDKLAPMLMVKDYLGFAVKLLLAFGLVFEVPIFVFFLAYAGIVTAGQLVRFGRWFVVLSVIFAAILTPPDVVTQVMLATPLIILYYASILIVVIIQRKST